MRLRAQDSTGLALSCPNEECVICAESFATDDVVTVLPCGHMHHSNCILHWLHRQCTCPTCRFDLHKHAAVEQQQELQDGETQLFLKANHKASTSSSFQQQLHNKSENFDLILRRTLRMKLEAEQLVRKTKNDDTESDGDSVAETVSSSDFSLDSHSRCSGIMDHAHFLEMHG